LTVNAIGTVAIAMALALHLASQPCASQNAFNLLEWHYAKIDVDSGGPESYGSRARKIIVRRCQPCRREFPAHQAIEDDLAAIIPG
jgi:hypothetical protein